MVRKPQRWARFSSWMFASMLTCCLPYLSFATHNRAGDITYEQIGPLTIRVTITTYTKTSSVSADRDTLELHWGDGTSSKLGRVNGEGDRLPNDIKRNFYIGEHTYPGRATYHMYFSDPNRIGNIRNLNYPNSIKIPFHVQTTFTFLTSQFQGSNSSAILLQPPIDYACVGKPFIYNPNAYDPDGDSLSYELIVPLQEVNTLVPNYVDPDQIVPGNNNQFSLDERTGDIVWDAPRLAGEYNIAFKIHEYRQGVLLNSIIRDMQILVEACDNNPPVIETVDEICVVAGEKVEFDVLATDPDLPQNRLALSALGGPFETDVSPATFSSSGRYQAQPISATFTWQTACEHITEHAYSVVFKAVDDTRDSTGLATLKTVLIKVVGPPPQNLVAVQEGNQNLVSWDQPYACEVTEGDYFLGFTIWRRNNSNRFPIDTCNPGLEGKGYTPIAYGWREASDGRYRYRDDDITLGEVYCYRVTATFAHISIAGYRYNHVESMPSNEDCAGILLDKPYIVNNSILNTGTNEGSIEVRWTRPDPEDFDTTVFRGPYRFVLERGDGFEPATFSPVTGASFESPTFHGLIDTHFIDSQLNTADLVYTYRVAFYTSQSFLFSTSDPASSVRLSASGSDLQMNLSWQAAVPWENYSYKIYRKDPGQSDYFMIGTSSTTTYKDEGLVNGLEYCYFIETEGTYGFVKLPEPLLNLSQEICQMPMDAVPPCVPDLTVLNSCDDPSLSRADAFINRLFWQFDFQTCPDPEDVAGYRIYHTPRPDSTLSLLIEIEDEDVTTYDHVSTFGISGCYVVTALDSLGNESDSSTAICVENCPFYQLPNTFTPNGDGSNDLFVPFPYKFIDQIDIQIFNRWGQLVYKTTDPKIEWDGTNLSGNDLAQGVYHYICHVYEAGVDGELGESSVLKGFIELIR